MPICLKSNLITEISLRYIPIAILHTSVCLSASQVDLFKQFLQDPPIVEELLATITHRTRYGDGSIETNTAIYEIRYQPGCRYFRQLTSLDDLESFTVIPIGLVASRYHGKYWQISRSVATVADSRNNPKGIDKDITIPLLRTESILSKQIHFGFPGTLLGSIRWNGNDVVPYTNFINVRVEGRLLTHANQYATGLELRATLLASGRHVRWSARYRYGHSADIPPFLPARIDCYASHEFATNWLSDTITILTLKTNAKLLPEEAFSLEPLIASNHLHVAIQTNGILMTTNRFERGLVPVPRHAPPGKMKRWYFIGIWIFLSGGLLVLLLRMRKHPAKG